MRRPADKVSFKEDEDDDDNYTRDVIFVIFVMLSKLC